MVAPYVAAHAAGRTPNPCVACNRHLKFGRLLQRARVLGFDAVATGHHARVLRTTSGRYELRRGADRAKDQSYVVAMLTQDQLAAIRFPVGTLTKAEVRRRAQALGLGPRPSRTARMSASSAVREGGRHFSGHGSPCTPAGWSMRRAVPSSVTCLLSSW